MPLAILYNCFYWIMIKPEGFNYYKVTHNLSYLYICTNTITFFNIYYIEQCKSISLFLTSFHTCNYHPRVFKSFQFKHEYLIMINWTICFDFFSSSFQCIIYFWFELFSTRAMMGFIAESRSMSVVEYDNIIRKQTSFRI